MGYGPYAMGLEGSLLVLELLVYLLSLSLGETLQAKASDIWEQKMEFSFSDFYIYHLVTIAIIPDKA